MSTSDILMGSRHKIKNLVIEEIPFVSWNAVIHSAAWTGLWIDTAFHSVTNKPNATLHEINAGRAGYWLLCDISTCWVWLDSTDHTLLNGGAVPQHGLASFNKLLFKKKQAKKKNHENVNEFVSLWKERHGGKREELISGVADHYPHHTCVIALITPLNPPLSPIIHKQQTNSPLNDKLRTQGSLCQSMRPCKMIQPAPTP